MTELLLFAQMTLCLHNRTSFHFHKEYTLNIFQLLCYGSFKQVECFLDTELVRLLIILTLVCYFFSPNISHISYLFLGSKRCRPDNCNCYCRVCSLFPSFVLLTLTKLPRPFLPISHFPTSYLQQTCRKVLPNPDRSD